MKIPQYVGYICAGIAGLCFGSNFVPVKQYETGDGLFFQWIMCAAIWICGFIVNATRGFPPFQPLAMLGGFLWCTGNVMSVTIIKLIGLSLGMLLWGLSNLLMGWFSGTFGLFGLKPETVNVPGYNIAAAVLAVASAICYFFIEPLQKDDSSDDESNGKVKLINEGGHSDDLPDDSDWINNLSPLKRRIIGCG
eukprot:TRINITY_DN3400_c0_g1_i2.p1 TRINITY_DN3400_c0_g1~~TRINITY_DN3400_c0_g1_i2.p1  ORF type:complete len:193 (-),score=30.65 TRINITY_DN3400_c0_g1_i2:636-1214(-)